MTCKARGLWSADKVRKLVARTLRRRKMPSLQSIPSLQTTHAQSTWRAWIYPEASVVSPRCR